MSTNKLSRLQAKMEFSAVVYSVWEYIPLFLLGECSGGLNTQFLVTKGLPYQPMLVKRIGNLMDLDKQLIWRCLPTLLQFRKFGFFISFWDRILLMKWFLSLRSKQNQTGRYQREEKIFGIPEFYHCEKETPWFQVSNAISGVWKWFLNQHHTLFNTNNNIMQKAQAHILKVQFVIALRKRERFQWERVL